MKFFLQLCIILGFPAQAATLEKLEDGNSKICGEVVEVLNPKTSISPYLINFNFSVTRKDNKLLKNRAKVSNCLMAKRCNPAFD